MTDVDKCNGRLEMEFHIPIRGHQTPEDLHLDSLPVALSEFMSLQPRSSYTTCLSTGNANKLFHLEFHCRRLIEGFKALEPTAKVPTPQELKAALERSIAKIVRISAVPPETEIQFVIILRQAERKPYLRIHASLVPPGTWDQESFDFVAVECQKGQRLHPAVKDTSWYTERIPFEQMRGESATETVLVGNDEGAPVLLEGLVTNIFVITDDLDVWTAGEEFVLSGSMRDLVLQACDELKVRVVEKAAPLSSWRQYQAAFLTNARRILQPISKIEVPHSTRRYLSDVPGIITLREESDAVDLMKELRQRVTLIIERIAQDIF